MASDRGNDTPEICRIRTDGTLKDIISEIVATPIFEVDDGAVTVDGLAVCTLLADGILTYSSLRQAAAR